jgi:hypothetical protein
MTGQDLLLGFDESVTRADVDGRLRHLGFAGRAHAAGGARRPRSATTRWR